MSLLAKNISFAYPGELRSVVDRVSVEVHRGEFVVLLGANGSGKSTLIRLLSSLYLPDQGHVQIDDIKTNDADQRLNIRRKVGMLFQHPENQIVAQTVADDIAFGLENLNQSPSVIEKKVFEILEKIGLEGFADRSPDELSGGQLQRLALGGVLALEPDYLLIDEPFAWLDLEAQQALLPLLKSICNTGCGIIVISHEPDVLPHADRVWLMHQGQLNEMSPQSLAHRPQQFESVGLEAPSVLKLCQKLKPHLRLPENLLDLKSIIEHLQSQVDDSSTEVQPSKQATSKTPLLQMENVGFTYNPHLSKQDWLISNVNFTINQGDWVVLSGSSGCGKSTFAQLFNGLLKPNAGNISLQDKSILKQSITQLCQQVGLVFQNPRQQFFAPTVFEEMAYALQAQGVPSDAIKQRVYHVCEQLHLNTALLNRVPQTLSGGEQLKAALGSLLLLDPQLLILDETLTSLDSGSRRTILNLLQELNQSGLSLMTVTHRPSQLPWANLAWLQEGNLTLYETEEIPTKWLPNISKLSEIFIGIRSTDVDQIYQELLQRKK